MKAQGEEKQCSKCKQWLPLDEFTKNKSFPDGLQNWCKTCMKAYYDANYERRLEYNRGYVAEHREHVREYQRSYRQEHPEAKEKAAERSRRHYEDNKDKALDQSKRWHAENPEKVQKTQQDYYARNREARRESSRRWRADNPDKVAAQNAERRAREAGASTEEEIDFKRIYQRDRDICYLCGRKVKKSERHLDHVIPLSRGGTHSEDNLRLTHARCNLIKGSKLVEEIDPAKFQ